MTIATHYLAVGTRTVHYRHRGRGSPVVLLHASPRASGALETLMEAAPDGRSVFALDTPGFGWSDALPADQATIEDFADALAETLTALGIGRTNLYGTHTGADIALVYAVRHPERVARLVLDGVSCFDASERADFALHYLPPFEPRPDGAHMAWLWSRLRDQALFFPWYLRTAATRVQRPMPDASELQRAAIDWLVAGHRDAAYLGSIAADSATWIARIAVPTWIGARDGDVLQSHLRRLAAIPACATVERFPAAADAWSTRIWELLKVDAGGAAVASDAPLPIDRTGDTHVGATGRRIHWRGRMPRTRPIVVLHASPGSARTVQRVDALALDLPGHGESDPLPDAQKATMVDAADEALVNLGLDAADLVGEGCGAAVATALAARRPGRWEVHATCATRGGMVAPTFAAPRDDGGHLLAAWITARDAAILGPWWSRDPSQVHDFGDRLDWAAIHRAAVAQLLEARVAAEWRALLG